MACDTQCELIVCEGMHACVCFVCACVLHVRVYVRMCVCVYVYIAYAQVFTHAISSLQVQCSQTRRQ